MTFDALPATPAFPAGELNVRAELLLGGTWTNVSTYIFQDTTTITRGSADESTTATASTFLASLNNSDGRFSSLNPTGPYYGLLGLNTPIRVSVPEGASYLRLEGDAVSYASCPDSAGVSITGDMDLQLDVTLDNWRANQILAAKYAETGNQKTWKLLLQESGNLSFVFSSNGTTIAGGTNSSAFGGAGMVPVPPLGRLCVRVTFQASTGNVKFYTAPAGLTGASWTLLGDTSSFGAASLFDSTAPVQLGYCSDDATGDPGFTGINGKIHAAQLLSGIGGTAKASPDFTAQTPGATSFADAQSNTWTLAGTSEISNRKYRFHGECGAWPQTWTPGDPNAVVALSAGGLLRRYGQASASINSPMFRAYARLSQTGAVAPLAYWPCEDMANATQIASGLGGQPIRFSGFPNLASNSAFVCSAPIPVLNGSTWTGGITDPGGTANVLRFLMQAPAGGDTNGATVVSLNTTGTVARADLIYYSSGGLGLNLYSSSGSTLVSTGAVAGLGLNGAASINGGLLRVSVELTVSGGTITYGIVTYGVGGTAGRVSSGTISGSIGPASRCIFNGGGAMTGTAIGHISYANTWDTLFDIGSALGAWQGETAGNRFKRLCGEEGITFRGKGNLDDTVAMGAQSLATLPSLLQECVDADRGVWIEPRQVLGWGYRTHASLGNQTAAVTLDYNQDHLSNTLAPTIDDQVVKNDVTASNSTGSSSRQVLSTGSMSIQAPPNGIGRYDTSVSVNLASDALLDNEAGWILSTLTVNVPRYPEVNVDLANTALAALYYAILDADLGDRIVVANPPINLPPGLIDQLIKGTSEPLSRKALSEKWNTVPTLPWNVAYANDAVVGRADTDGSTLVAAALSGDTTLQVGTTNNASPAWTTSAGDFPFDITVGGEQITVTGIGANNWLTGQPGTFEGGIANWNNDGNCTVSAGSVAHSGTGSLKMTSQAAGSMAAESTFAGAGVNLGNFMPCKPGDVISASAWFRAATVGRSCVLAGQFVDATFTDIAYVYGPTVTSNTTGWTQAVDGGTIVAPAGSVYVLLDVGVNSTAAANEVHYADDITMTNQTQRFQTFTATRSVNGVVKPQAQGASVMLANSPTAAL